jgi:superfamily II DNA or RNA helicase
MSPLKIHVKQNLERTKKFLPYYESLLLDSDLDGSTDFNDLKNILDKKSLISATFDSGENLFKNLFENIDDNNKNLEIINNNSLIDLSNSILIVDEAHNLINREKLMKIIKLFPKVLLVTATPPSCMEELLEHELIYHYPFRIAIKEKFICDYQIYLPLIINNYENELNNIDINIPNELIDLDENLSKKSLFLINGLLDTGSKKCIAYFNSNEECVNFINNILEVNKKYHYLDLWVNIINSEISYVEREKIINEFQNENYLQIKILCSIRILNEGIDIPKCDSIFINKISDNSNDIITFQRICRANRLVKENPTKVANCFIWTDDLNKIIGSLSLLKENDIEFHKKIQISKSNYDKKNIKSEINKEKENNLILQEFVKVKCVNYEEIWEIKKNLLFKYCEYFKKIPISGEKYENCILFNWFQNQLKKINSIDNILYIKLTENIFLKKYIDYYLKKKNIILNTDIIDNINITKNIIEKIDLKGKFICKRCGYDSNQIIDIKRHLEKQKKCEWKNGENLNLSDIEIYNLSIQKRYENTENIIKKYEENKEKIKNENINLEEYNITCEYCYKKFYSVGNLSRHIKICKTKKIINKKYNENNQNITNIKI